MLQLTGDFNKMVALQTLLEPYGICEVPSDTCAVAANFAYRAYRFLIFIRERRALSCPVNLVEIFCFN